MTAVALKSVTPEREVLHAIRLGLGTERDLCLLRNNVGTALGGATGGVVYGLGTGSPDLVGTLAPTGRWFCLEVKRAGQKARPEQAAWLARHRKFGAFCAVVHSLDEARDALVRARAGACE